MQSEIYLALDRKYVGTEDFKCVYDMATSTKKSINAFIAYLRKSKPKTARPQDYMTTRPNDYKLEEL